VFFLYFLRYGKFLESHPQFFSHFQSRSGQLGFPVFGDNAHFSFRRTGDGDFLGIVVDACAGLQGLTISLWMITSANRLIHRSFVTCLRSGLRKWTLLTDQQLIFKNYRRSHILWFPQNLKVADTLGVLIRDILLINL
jgi:hypothetical protein